MLKNSLGLGWSEGLLSPIIQRAKAEKKPLLVSVFTIPFHELVGAQATELETHIQPRTSQISLFSLSN